MARSAAEVTMLLLLVVALTLSAFAAGLEGRKIIGDDRSQKHLPGGYEPQNFFGGVGAGVFGPGTGVGSGVGFVFPGTGIGGAAGALPAGGFGAFPGGFGLGVPVGPVGGHQQPGKP